MKTILIISLLLCSVVFTACEKVIESAPSTPRPYSTWYVNGQKISRNDIRLDQGKARHQIAINDLQEGYKLYFNLGSFPTNGQFQLNCSAQNPAWCCLMIAYKGVGYFNHADGYIQAESKNGHTQYVLGDDWFFNESDAQDSILVSGTFIVP